MLGGIHEKPGALLEGAGPITDKSSSWAAGDETRAIIAILHDVIKNSAWSAADLAHAGRGRPGAASEAKPKFISNDTI
jgi:hypothetical protein